MSLVRLAIVDDALFIREGLRRLLAGHPRIEVVGTAASGLELIANLDAWRPDVVTLDLNMPGMDGLTTLDRLMATRPLPVIILSTRSGAGAPQTVEALGRGAVDFIDKEAYSLVDFEALRAVLVEKILGVTAGAGCRVSGAGEKTVAAGEKPGAAATPFQARHPAPGTRSPFSLAVIGASTGGPRAVEAVLRALGTELPVPVVIAQHMPAGFTRAFAERLDRALPFPVREAVAGAVLEPGCAWIAPGGVHTEIDGGEARLVVREDVGGALHAPSVDALFSSAARAYGEHVVAVLLTGMGRDGAGGMAALSLKGAHTIAESEASCIVYGMPRAAVECGAAREILPLGQIGPRVRSLLGGDPHQEN